MVHGKHALAPGAEFLVGDLKAPTSRSKGTNIVACSTQTCACPQICALNPETAFGLEVVRTRQSVKQHKVLYIMRNYLTHANASQSDLNAASEAAASNISKAQRKEVATLSAQKFTPLDIVKQMSASAGRTATLVKEPALTAKQVRNMKAASSRGARHALLSPEDRIGANDYTYISALVDAIVKGGVQGWYKFYVYACTTIYSTN